VIYFFVKVLLFGKKIVSLLSQFEKHKVKNGIFLSLMVCVSVVCKSQTVEGGMTLHDRGEYEKAIAWYERMLKKDSADLNTYYEMALSYFELGNYDRTLQCCTRVINKTGSEHLKVKSMNLKANAFAKRGEIEKAIQMLQEAIKQDKYEDASLLYNLGYIYYIYRRNIPKALEYLSQAIVPGFNEPDYFLAYAYALQDAGRWVESFFSYQNFLFREHDTGRSNQVFKIMFDILLELLKQNPQISYFEAGMDLDPIVERIRDRDIVPKNDSQEENYRFFAEATKNLCLFINYCYKDPANVDNDELDFIWDNFVSLYIEMLQHDSHLFDTYCRYISSSYFTQSYQWLQKQTVYVNEFNGWYSSRNENLYEDPDEDYGDDSDEDDADYDENDY
jgi:tetratricopeptide (TPR) repeat protein